MFKKIITTTILILTFLTFNICVFAEPLSNDSNIYWDYFKPEKNVTSESYSSNSLSEKINMQNNLAPFTIYQQPYIRYYKHPETEQIEDNGKSNPKQTNNYVEIIEVEKDYDSVFNQYYGYMKTLNHLV